MSESEFRSVIVDALTEVGLGDEPAYAAKLADPSADLSFAELEIDSLAAAEVSTLIEDKTGVACDIGDFLLHASVNALATELAARRDNEPVN